MLQPGGFLLNPLLKYGITFGQFCRHIVQRRFQSIAISLRPLMFARWVKSRWLTALAIAAVAATVVAVAPATR